jgi:dTDP-4-dehydrorhamnose reductase
MAQTKILITGANGQVGYELARARWPEHCVIDCRTRHDLDITDAKMVCNVVIDGDYDIIINAAAYTAVDNAETEPAAASAGNKTGPKNLAIAADRIGAALIHISTDYVFDGQKDAAYGENDPVAPLGVYGQSKEAGERAIRETLTRHLILRTAWVYGAHGHNFVKTMLRLAGSHKEISVVGDQIGCPTAAAFIADSIVSLVRKIIAGGEINWGTYHLSNSGEASWHDFATAIYDLVAAKGLPTPIVHKITSAEYPTLAERPKNSRLNTELLHRTFAIQPPNWRESLKPVMDEICANPKDT